MVGQTGSIHLLEVILVWEFLATRENQVFVVLWGCQAFLNLSFALRNLCLALCLVLLDSSNLDRTSLPDVEKTQNKLFFLVATLLI